MYPVQIAHFDLDTFFVSVERLLDPSLMNKPVVVGGNPHGRGVVAGCSYEARAYGIHSAQPIGQAFRLCPNAVFLRGNHPHYGEYSRRVYELLRDMTPVCEQASVDEFYVDLSGCERLAGNIYLWAQRIQQAIRDDTKLPISFGLGTSKLIAKIATSQVAKKGVVRHHEVPAGTERAFLAPLPIRAMPGIGAVMQKQLEALGIQRLGQLAELPAATLETRFGKTGLKLHRRANGIDSTPVITSRQQHGYSRERTFSSDTVDQQFLFAQLLALSSQLAADLRADNILAEKITLKLRYTDFQTYTRTHSCAWTNGDQAIYRVAEKLFTELYTRNRKVRLLGVEAHSLSSDIEQPQLFNEESAFDHVYSTIDSLKEKYGKNIIAFAATRR